MTDRIDLDELDEPAEEASERRDRGDWLWDPSAEGPAQPAGAGDEPDGPADHGSGSRGGVDRPGDDDVDAGPAAADGTDAGDRRDRPAPHVPRPNKDKPVGIPVEGGGADAGAPRSREAGPPGPGQADASGSAGGTSAAPGEDPRGEGGDSPPGEASGPHGGGADAMTLALTYAAASRLDDPARALADARQWADWVGIVGDVEAHVINKFQRDHHVDVDFFNGSGTGPGERLAGIDEHSMFFAERLVVVGVEGRDEPVAGAAGWEFVPLATAAEKANWALGR